MSSLFCICILIGYVLMMTSLLTTEAAPTRERRRVEDTNADTVLSLVLDGSDDTDISSSNFADADLSPNTRQRRSAAAEPSLGGRHHRVRDDVALALDEEDLRDLSPSARRRRRSAAWWMAAMVALCDKHQVCRQVQITEGDLTMVVKMAEE